MVFVASPAWASCDDFERNGWTQQEKNLCEATLNNLTMTNKPTDEDSVLSSIKNKIANIGSETELQKDSDLQLVGMTVEQVEALERLMSL